MNKNKIIAAQKSKELLDYLLHRRSTITKTLQEPGPSSEEITKILSAASRVPDHGKLNPWHFIVFQGENRKAIGDLLLEAYKTEDPNASEAKLELESERFLRAPTVIAVISRLRKSKHPAWEQYLSAGAACQNLCLAANALGYGTHWLTEWYSYNNKFHDLLSLDERDNIAGFIYIGTPQKAPEERDRPDLKKITTYWTSNASLNKGDEDYDRENFDLPTKKMKLLKNE